MRVDMDSLDRVTPLDVKDLPLGQAFVLRGLAFRLNEVYIKVSHDSMLHFTSGSLHPRVVGFGPPDCPVTPVTIDTIRYL